MNVSRSDALVFFGASGDLAYKKISRHCKRWSIARGIPYHSIIGDRDRGDTPNSSDGVVPYWSSHLPGAQSELIVNSDHGAQYNPQAIREVERILRLNPTGPERKHARTANMTAR